MTKTKKNYSVETKTRQLDDTATGEAGAVAQRTLATEEIELSNDYHIPFHAIDVAVVKTSDEQIEVKDDTCDDGTEPTPAEPKIVGANDVTIKQGADFDLMNGVKAYDADGKEIPVSVSPTEIEICEVGTQEFTYTAEGVEKTRKVTIQQNSNPVISGLTDLTVEVGEEFDPLEGVTAKDGNGNDVEVEVIEPEPEDVWVTIWSGMYVDADSTYNFTTVYDTDEIKKIRLVISGQTAGELNGNEIHDGAFLAYELALVVDNGLTAFVPQSTYDGIPMTIDVVLK